MTSFESYNLYSALKRHFTCESYDYFKYNGKVKTSLKTFQNRNDKFFFEKLSKHKDVLGLVVSNMLVDPNIWVGDLVNEERCSSTYFNWLRRKESLSYVFKSELNNLDENLMNELVVENDSHPKLFKKYLAGEICAETIIILEDIINFFPMWDKKIKETFVWPSEKIKLTKYKPFVNIKPDYKQVIVDHVKLSSNK